MSIKMHSKFWLFHICIAVLQRSNFCSLINSCMVIQRNSLIQGDIYLQKGEKAFKFSSFRRKNGGEGRGEEKDDIKSSPSIFESLEEVRFLLICTVDVTTFFSGVSRPMRLLVMNAISRRRCRLQANGLMRYHHYVPSNRRCHSP